VSNGAGVTGNIVLTLEPTIAPATTANFLLYVNSGVYDGVVFHRQVAGFVLQGGGSAGPAGLCGVWHRHGGHRGDHGRHPPPPAAVRHHDPAACPAEGHMGGRAS
jgi:cyclophilin family peptidyl-prolyl cis-trans isomerase